MARSQKGDKKISFEDMRVVDCDVHVMSAEEVRRDIADRMEEPWSSHLHPDKDPKGNPYPRTPFATSIQNWGRGEEHEALVDPEEDVEEALCKEFGIDHPILNMGAGGVDLIPEDERRKQTMQAKNDVLIDRFLDANDDFYGVITLETCDPESAVEEIDRLGGENQIVGAYVQLRLVDPPLGDPRYDVVYDAMQDHGLTLTLHSGAGISHNYHRITWSLNNYLQLHTLGHPLDHMINLTSMIYEGVPVKFPDMNVVHTEAGIGWAAYLMGRMNRDYRQRRFDAPLLEKSPEQHIRDNWYFGTQPMEEYDHPGDYQHLVDVVSPDNIVFATDHPHFDFDYPASTDRFYSNLSQEDREKIFWRNAAEAYGLDL